VSKIDYHTTIPNLPPKILVIQRLSCHSFSLIEGRSYKPYPGPVPTGTKLITSYFQPISANGGIKHHADTPEKNAKDNRSMGQCTHSNSLGKCPTYMQPHRYTSTSYPQSRDASQSRLSCQMSITRFFSSASDVRKVHAGSSHSIPKITQSRHIHPGHSPKDIIKFSLASSQLWMTTGMSFLSHLPLLLLQVQCNILHSTTVYHLLFTTIFISFVFLLFPALGS
jgi:hypothetical protein